MGFSILKALASQVLTLAHSRLAEQRETPPSSQVVELDEVGVSNFSPFRFRV
jgi:hypothetical protein